ncbi:LysR family transcriptional regulator [Mariniflexile sp. HMF6888]|uniref:LysR family transcriptional regulator n=1 Tax=Mariniflexile sp. HMF6888 TaxID=3373086 RepID=UPI0037B3E067
MVNLEWYRTFTYVYEYGSLTTASQKLYMSQPGVGKQIAALESEVGKQLFERTTRKMLPTEYGKFLYSQIAVFIEGLEKAEQKFRRGSSKNCPSIVVGCSYDFFHQFILKKIPEINMFLTFKFGDMEELITYLEKDKIHLMVSDREYSGYDHNFSLIKESKLSLYASKKLYKDAPFEKIDKKNSKEIQQWLSEQLWYAYDNDLPNITAFWKANFNSRPQVKAKYVFPSFRDIVTMMDIGHGLAVLPDYIGINAVKNGVIKPMFINSKKTNCNLLWVNKRTTNYHYEINLLTDALNIK